jgi:hypothetical protein
MTSRTIPLFSYVLLIVLVSVVSAASDPDGYRPPQGFIPDEKTAICVAEAVLSPIFGEENIRKQRPFKASLKDDIWTVTGHLDDDLLGGVAQIRIAKGDGQILGVSHGK